MAVRSGFRALVAISGLTLWVASGAHAGLTGPYFAVTDLGTLGGPNSQADDINDAGQIVGAADGLDGRHAFLWSGGQMHALGDLGGSSSEALRINRAGVAVGYAFDANGTRKPARWTGGVIEDLSPGGPSGIAFDINDSGVSVGRLGSNAVAWTGGGTVTLPIGSAYAYAINNSGTIVATDHIYDSDFSPGKTWVDQIGGAWTPIPYTATFAAINNAGVTCMTAILPIGGWPQPAIDFSSDVITSLRPFLSRGDARGINDAGAVVGQQWMYNKALNAFLYIPGSGTFDLNARIDPNSGWLLQSAEGINAAGQIVGYGLINGHQHAFLLTPAPLPPRANIQGSAALDLGSVVLTSASRAQTLTITNDGTAPLMISGVLLGGWNDVDFHVSGGAGLTVAAGASTDLTVTFSPTNVGSRSANLLINSNALNSPTIIALTGTGVALPPGAPSGLSARAIGYGKINLAWTDNCNNETAFEVFRQVGSGGFARIAVIAPDSTSYTDYTAVGSTSYTYEVRAANDTWASAFSNPASVTTAFPPTVPTSLTVVGHSYNKVSLGWTDNSNNETAFEVYRQAGSGPWALIGVVAPNTTFFQDTTVSPATSYAYRVRAANDYWASAYTNAVTVTTVQAPPAAPSGLMASAVGTKIMLHWTDNSTNETAFELYRKVGSGSFALLAVLAPNSTGYTDTGMVGSTDYGYEVRAANNLWASEYANMATVMTAFPPAAPSGLSATAASSTQINLSWVDNSTNETAFEVYRQTGTGAYVLAAVLAPGTTAYADRGTVGNTTYTYRVRAANDYWASAYTNVTSAHTP